MNLSKYMHSYDQHSKQNTEQFYHYRSSPMPTSSHFPLPQATAVLITITIDMFEEHQLLSLGLTHQGGKFDKRFGI